MGFNGNDDDWRAGYEKQNSPVGSSADSNSSFQQGVQQRQREEQERFKSTWDQPSNTVKTNWGLDSIHGSTSAGK
ncbi:MAG: hypothetical protein QOI12_155 [Alphaproteobacteria bacterium]|jgi:hypothetical protein|nr:hypothetical protein [Alphaproteobacteria bacterium]